MIKINKLVKKYPLLTALFGYSAITIIVFHNLVTNIFTKLVGVGMEGATGQSMWHYWFITKLLSGRENLLGTSLIFYPEKPSLIVDNNEFISSLLSLPFQLVSLIFATNMVVLISVVLSAFGAFLIIRKICKNNVAAFISGIIFAFSPVIMTHFSHGWFNVAITWMILFHIFFLIKTFENGSVKFGLLSGFFLTLVTYNYLVQVVVFLPLSLILSTYYLMPSLLKSFKKINLSLWAKAKLLPAVVVYLSWFVLSVPLFWQLWKAKSYIPFEVPLSIQNFWSPNIENFLTPSPKNIVFGKFSSNLGIESEFTIFLGYSAIILVLIGVFLFLKRRKRVQPIYKLWGFALVFFFILSLGPLLHMGGETSFKIGDLTANLPLPFIFYQKIPLIGGIQEPVRFVYPMTLCLAVICGVVLTYLMKRVNKVKTFLFVLIVGLVIADYMLVNIPTFAYEPVPIYDKISQDKENYTVLDVPIGRVTGSGGLGVQVSAYSYYQTIHGKSMINGYVARTPGWMVTRYNNVGLFFYLITIQDEGCPPKFTDNPEVREGLADYKVGYIVIHKDMVKESIRKDNYYENAEKLDCFVKMSGYQKVSEDAKTIVLKK